jgi:hypothetical protein
MKMLVLDRSQPRKIAKYKLKTDKNGINRYDSGLIVMKLGRMGLEDFRVERD